LLGGNVPARFAAAVCAAAILVAGAATGAAIPTDIQVRNIPIKTAKAADIAGYVCVLYPEIRCSADDRTNMLIIRGPANILPGVQKLATQLDRAKPAPGSTAPLPASEQDIRVFPIRNPEAGPSILTAVATLMQGISSTAGTTGTAGTSSSSGGDKKAAGAGFAAAVLTPGQDGLIVRGDPHILDLIDRKVLAALQKQAVAPQAFETYDVRFAVPNPTLIGNSLVATSTISDLAQSVQTAMTQTGYNDVKVSPDPSYPRILVAGSRFGVRRALEFLAKLDRRPALVDLQAQFYEIDDNKANDLGIQLPTGSIQTTIGEYFPPTTAGTASVSPTPSPVFSVGKITKSPISITAQLNLLLQTGSAMLIATPHVATINGRLTSISVQNTIPFVAVSLTPSGTTIPGVKDYFTGTKLEIIPMINSDGSISAYVHPVYTTLSGLTQQQAPLTSAREMSSTFRLQSGQAAYISGLEETNEATTRQRIPVLSKIPLVGGLFRNKGYQYTHTSLFIVLTASVIDPGDLLLPSLEIDPSHPPIPLPRPLQKPYPVAPRIPEPSSVPTIPTTPMPRGAVSPTDSPAWHP
jgi:type II secretory pathway component GspD/PulD (secretin)